MLDCAHSVTRQDPVDAPGGVLGMVALAAHEMLQVSSGVLQFVPVSGLQEAVHLVLKIWDAVQAVKVRAHHRYLAL